MSQTYIAVLVGVLAQVLPWMGIEIGSEELTNTVTTLVTIATGLWIMYARYKKGDITPLGLRK